MGTDFQELDLLIHIRSLEILTFFNAEIMFLLVFPVSIINGAVKDFTTKMLIATLFSITRNWKQPELSTLA